MCAYFLLDILLFLVRFFCCINFHFSYRNLLDHQGTYKIFLMSFFSHFVIMPIFNADFLLYLPVIYPYFVKFLLFLSFSLSSLHNDIIDITDIYTLTHTLTPSLSHTHRIVTTVVEYAQSVGGVSKVFVMLFLRIFILPMCLGESAAQHSTAVLLVCLIIHLLSLRGL